MLQIITIHSIQSYFLKETNSIRISLACCVFHIQIYICIHRFSFYHDYIYRSTTKANNCCCRFVLFSFSLACRQVNPLGTDKFGIVDPALNCKSAKQLKNVKNVFTSFF